MAVSLVPIWCDLLFNLALQIIDGFLTYHVVSRGVPEGNPLVRSAMEQWGILWGLVYWKSFACVLLFAIFAVRHRSRALITNALALTGAVYAYVAVGGLCMLLWQFAK